MGLETSGVYQQSSIFWSVTLQPAGANQATIWQMKGDIPSFHMRHWRLSSIHRLQSYRLRLNLNTSSLVLTAQAGWQPITNLSQWDLAWWGSTNLNGTPVPWAIQSRNVPPQVSSISCKKNRTTCSSSLCELWEGIGRWRSVSIKERQTPYKSSALEGKMGSYFSLLTIWLRHWRWGGKPASCLLALGHLGSQIVRVIRSEGDRRGSPHAHHQRSVSH